MSDQVASNSSSLGPDLTGKQLGDYQLLRRLGHGGMAEVYLAEQRSLRRQVAIKVLRGDLATDATYVQRFHLEAQAAASFVHSGIVQIHEVGCADGIHFIAQEYVQGQNLRELLSRSGPPDLKRGLHIMFCVTGALAQAAEHGIVHRDIKPENIMLSRAGDVKVADFGLARLTSGEPGLNLTQVGITMGTPLYMSPEQVEGRPLDPRSDIYSLGVTCYHMLAGEPPFQAETALGVAVQHLKTDPPSLASHRPDLPEDLCRIVHRMLAKDPADRYQTAREIIRDLRSLHGEEFAGASHEPFEGGPSDGGPDDAASQHSTQRLAATERLAALMRSEKVPRQGRRRWLLTAGCLPVAFLGGGLAAWWNREPDLLAGAGSAAPAIARRNSAREQYEFARRFPSEDSWLSVKTYFPADLHYVRLAEQELAMLYLRRDDYAAADELFTKFANLGDVEEELRAFGLAGQCVVLCLQGDHERSVAKMNELFELRDKLRDPGMQLLLRQAIMQNRRALKFQTSQQWEAWAQARFDDDS